MKYLAEYETKLLPTREALEEAVQFYKEHDRWMYPNANDLVTFGVTDYPLLNGDIKERILESCPEDAFEDCVQDAGIFLTVPMSDKYLTFATRYTALNSIYERSGSSCRMVRNISDHGYIKALSAEERGEIINKGWKTSSEPLKVLYSDERISFVGSNKYVILPYDEGIQAAEETLEKNFNVEYLTGSISHEYLVCAWTISNEETMSHKLMLESTGLLNPESPVFYFFQFSSSNIGNAKMSGRLFVSVDGVTMPIGLPQSVWHLSSKKAVEELALDHDNGCSIREFAYKLEHFLGKSLKENEDVIEAMGNYTLLYPDDCLKHALAACPSIPKRLKEAAMDEFNGTLAIDVYLALSGALDGIQSLKTYVQATEEIASLQYRDFSQFDKKECE